MKPGRNDPCACGSGKKYKHCCLAAAATAQAAPDLLAWRRLRSALQGFPGRMMSFVGQTYGGAAVEEAMAEFFMDRDLDLESDPALAQLFTPWFFHFWSPDVDTQVSDAALRDVPPTAAYIARKRKQLDPLLVRYLESCLHAPLSFYDVVSRVPGERMILRDIFTGTEHDVIERSASAGHERGDIVFAQLAAIDGLTVMEAYGGFPIAPQEKARVVTLRARMTAPDERLTADGLRDFDIELLDLFLDIYLSVFHPAPPELRTTDGEPVSMRRLVYDLAVSPQVAFDALKHLALDEPEASILQGAERDADGSLRRVSFSWKRRGNAMHADWDNTVLGHITIAGAKLTAEVSSEPRADRFADLIEAALGEGAEFRVTHVTSSEEMLAKARAGAQARANANDDDDDEKADDPESDPEIRARLAEISAQHFERWSDLPLPILGGRTPREAVADRDGREVVTALLIQFERDTTRSGQPVDLAVFARLRERLGLSPAGD